MNGVPQVWTVVPVACVNRTGYPSPPALTATVTTLLAVVESLADQPSGRAACRAAGVRPEELGAYLAAQEDEKDGLEKERDDARSERDSARYVVESAAYYLARGDVAGAMAVLQEDVASRKYSAGSQAQDSLKGLAAQLGDKREWRRVGRRPSEGNGGAR